MSGRASGPAGGPVGSGPAAVQAWPGQRLGLPPAGRGSVGRLGRRVLALVLDWAACSLLSSAFFGYDSWATLALFAAEQVLLVGTLGASFGHVLVGLHVRRLDGGLPGPVKALVRAVLVSLVIPAVVYDADTRGLHDRAAGTVLTRR